GVLLGIVGIERKRPRDRALLIGGSQRIGPENQGLDAVVEVGNRQKGLLGSLLVDDVAAGQQGEGAQAGGAAQEPPARRVRDQLRRVLDQELRIDARDGFSRLHRTPPGFLAWISCLDVCPYRPMTMARRLLGTRIARVTWTARKPTMADIAKK